MNKINDNEVRMSKRIRLVLLDVVVPLSCVDDFRVKFGEAFGSDGNAFRKVEDHYRREDGWHIVLIVPEKDQYQLQAFVHSYSEAKGLSFEDATKTEIEFVAQAAGPVL